MFVLSWPPCYLSATPRCLLKPLLLKMSRGKTASFLNGVTATWDLVSVITSPAITYSSRDDRTFAAPLSLGRWESIPPDFGELPVPSLCCIYLTHSTIHHQQSTSNPFFCPCPSSPLYFPYAPAPRFVPAPAHLDPAPPSNFANGSFISL